MKVTLTLDIGDFRHLSQQVDMAIDFANCSLNAVDPSDLSGEELMHYHSVEFHHAALVRIQLQMADQVAEYNAQNRGFSG